MSNNNKHLKQALKAIVDLVNYIELSDTCSEILANPLEVAKKYRDIHQQIETELQRENKVVLHPPIISSSRKGDLIAYDINGKALSRVRGLTAEEAKSIFYLKDVEDGKVMLMWKIKPNRSLPKDSRAGSKSSGYVRYQNKFYKVEHVIQMIAN